MRDGLWRNFRLWLSYAFPSSMSKKLIQEKYVVNTKRMHTGSGLCCSIRMQCWKKQTVSRRGRWAVSYSESGSLWANTMGQEWLAHTVWGYYRHSAGDATERSRGSKPPKSLLKEANDWHRLARNLLSLPPTQFHEQGQGDERGLLLRPTDGKPLRISLLQVFCTNAAERFLRSTAIITRPLWQHG